MHICAHICTYVSTQRSLYQGLSLFLSLFIKIISEQSLVVDDGDIDNLENKVNVATKIAYEMAHLWFGNVVNPSWWTDEWLNEGIMMYIQTQVLEKV